jgi:hypothetical protein
MKLLIMQPPPVSRYLVPLRPYSQTPSAYVPPAMWQTKFHIHMHTQTYTNIRIRWKGHRRNHSWPNLGYYTFQLRQRNRDKAQSGQSPNRYLNPEVYNTKQECLPLDCVIRCISLRCNEISVVT